MVDPLSVSAGIASLLQLSATVVKYISGVKDAPGDLKRLMLEISSTKGILSDLQDLVQSGGSSLSTVQSLSAPLGPLEQFRSSLKRLDEMLASFAGFNKATMVLTWPFRKDDVKDIICMIERQKALFGLALQNDHIGLSRAMKEDFVEMKNDVKELRKGQEDQMNRDILTWISTLNFSTKQDDFFGRRQEGTGEWLLEADAFKSWLNGTERILWCNGLPGAGKTILTSIVVDYLERSLEREDAAIAYVYCSYKEKEDQIAVNLITSLLQQLVQRNAIISDGIVSLYHDHIKNQTRPTLAEWSKQLQSEIGRFSKVFIVIDALDECSESNGTRGSFLAEIRKLQSSIHLLITSRHILTMDCEFEKAACIEIHASDKDIKRYLEGRIERERRLVRHVEADPTLQETIINTIVQNAKGMFLLAQLHMDSLAKKLNRRDIRTALKNLPKELDDTYDEVMRRIWSQDEEEVKLAKQVLCWISYAFRPLTVREIQHALAVEPTDVDFDEDALPDQDVLVSVCAGLVTIDQESKIIRLVHYTTQEYFLRIRMTRFPCAQTSITTTCLVYISFDIFAKGYCHSDQELEARLHEYPLLEYAVNHWGDHARGNPEKAVEDLALKFLQHNSKLMCSNQVMHLPGYQYPGYSQRFLNRFTGLHITASFGLAGIVQLLLLHEDVDADSKDDDGRTPLSWAAGNGHERVAQLLLSRGVDADSKDRADQTPLSRAAENGHEKVVRLLLSRKGVDADSRNEVGQTPLLLAAMDGHEKVVQLLLSCEGVDADHKDWDDRTPLSRAAENGYEKVVQLLLSCRGVDADHKSRGDRTPLLWAAGNGNEKVVQLLLSREGVDADSKDRSDRTPLLWAARNGHEKVVQLLLSREGVDADSKDRGDRTPLSWAAEGGNEKVVQLLLSREGVDADSKDSDDRTPLSLAAMSGHEKVVQLLLSCEGVDADHKDWDDRTPLSRAAENGYEKVVQLLLSCEGVDADHKNRGDRTSLSWAAENGNEKVVQLLLSREGVDADSKDRGDRTPLLWATMYEREKAVQLLLSHEGVDANSKDRNGWTPLSWATRNGNEEMVQLLLSREDVDVDSKDSNDRTPLSWAAEIGHEKVVQLLLSREGVDADSKDKDGRTPLSWAAGDGNREAARLLLSHEGVDANSKDKDGRTPLSLAAANGHEGVVQLLSPLTPDS